MQNIIENKTVYHYSFLQINKYLNIFIVHNLKDLGFKIKLFWEKLSVLPSFFPSFFHKMY